MHTASTINRYIVARDRNVVRVRFDRRDPDPPAPTFPGAAALRQYRGDGTVEAGGDMLLRPGKATRR
jgi:hypothetical protein